MITHFCFFFYFSPTSILFLFSFFFFNDTATTEIYTLSYTTLFRSLGFAPAERLEEARPFGRGEPERRVAGDGATPRPLHHRSEEHTSELQSQSNLVCRLLLEKKKKKKQSRINVHNVMYRARDQHVQ